MRDQIASGPSILGCVRSGGGDARAARGGGDDGADGLRIWLFARRPSTLTVMYACVYFCLDFVTRERGVVDEGKEEELYLYRSSHTWQG